MAYFVDHPAVGIPGDIHTTQQNDLGAVRRASDGNSYIYLKGVASTVDGSMVVFSQGTWQSALLASGLRGELAIATAATVASTWGWYTYVGRDVAIARSAIASNVPLYAGGVSGSPDDVAVKGDQLMNCYATNAAAGSGDSTIIVLNRSFIGMSNESVG